MVGVDFLYVCYDKIIVWLCDGFVDLLVWFLLFGYICLVCIDVQLLDVLVVYYDLYLWLLYFSDELWWVLVGFQGVDGLLLWWQDISWWVVQYLLLEMLGCDVCELQCVLFVVWVIDEFFGVIIKFDMLLGWL